MSTRRTDLPTILYSLTAFGLRLCDGTRMRRNRPAAGRDELIRRAIGVGTDQAHALEWHIKLFGHDLHESGGAARTQFAAPGEQRRPAVFAKGDPGIHLISRRTVGTDLHRSGVRAQTSRQRETDNQRART